MAENLVVSGIELDSRDFLRAIAAAEKRLDELERSLGNTTATAKKQQDVFDGLGKKVVALAAAYGLFRGAQRVGSFIFDTNVEFQKLEATLGTVTGSVERGAAAFDLITEFAASTPFEVANLTESFIQLRVRGVDPTIDRMRGLGNFASAFVSDIGDLTGAIISAAAGMSQPIKRFGFDAQREGDKITLSFDGVTKTVDATVESISAFIAELGNSRFADAMSSRMLTLDGTLSNLADTASLAAKRVGEQGLNAELVTLVKTLEAAIAENDEFAESLGKSLAAGVKVSASAIELLIENTGKIILLMEALTGAAVLGGLASLAVKLRAAAVAAGGLSLAMTLNPVGIAIMAGAIGGPLLMSLLKSKDAASGLNDEFDRMARLSGEQLIALEAQTLAKIAQLRETANKRAGGAPGAESWTEREAEALKIQEAALQRIRELMSERQTLPGIDTGGGGGGGSSAAEKLAEDIQKLRQGLEQEAVALREGERAAFAYELTKQGIVGTAREQILAQYDQVEALRAEQKAQDEASKEAKRREEAVQGVLDGLREQNLELEQGAEALLRYRLQALGAEQGEIELAAALLRTNQQMIARNEAVEKAKRRAEKDAEEMRRRAEEPMRALTETGEQLFEDFGMSIADAMLGAELSIERMVDAALRDLARLAIRMAAFKIFSGLVGAAAGGPVGAAAAMSAGSVGDGVFGGFAASGANFSRGERFMVGERGPEMVEFGRSGQIRPVQAQQAQARPMVINLPALPPPMTPFDAARDALWQRMWRDTAKVAESQGFKLTVNG